MFLKTAGAVTQSVIVICPPSPNDSIGLPVVRVERPERIARREEQRGETSSRDTSSPRQSAGRFVRRGLNRQISSPVAALTATMWSPARRAVQHAVDDDRVALDVRPRRRRER